MKINYQMRYIYLDFFLSKMFWWVTTANWNQTIILSSKIWSGKQETKTPIHKIRSSKDIHWHYAVSKLNKIVEVSYFVFNIKEPQTNLKQQLFLNRLSNSFICKAEAKGKRFVMWFPPSRSLDELEGFLSAQIHQNF